MGAVDGALGERVHVKAAVLSDREEEVTILRDAKRCHVAAMRLFCEKVLEAAFAPFLDLLQDVFFRRRNSL